jgi:hypothetical protein
MGLFNKPEGRNPLSFRAFQWTPAFAGVCSLAFN